MSYTLYVFLMLIFFFYFLVVALLFSSCLGVMTTPANIYLILQNVLFHLLSHTIFLYCSLYIFLYFVLEMPQIIYMLKVCHFGCCGSVNQNQKDKSYGIKEVVVGRAGGRIG